jgi:uncharacterized protein (UPF0332 family)
LLKEGKIVPHKTSQKEISNLFEIIERDLKDATFPELSADRRFATAYNACLQAATVIMYCEGFRTRGTGHHATTFELARLALGKEFEELIDYFDSCRVKRNITDYTKAGHISEKEADELLSEAKEFFEIVKKWLKKNYPQFSPS